MGGVGARVPGCGVGGEGGVEPVPEGFEVGEEGGTGGFGEEAVGGGYEEGGGREAEVDEPVKRSVCRTSRYLFPRWGRGPGGCKEREDLRNGHDISEKRSRTHHGGNHASYMRWPTTKPPPCQWTRTGYSALGFDWRVLGVSTVTSRRCSWTILYVRSTRSKASKMPAGMFWCGEDDVARERRGGRHLGDGFVLKARQYVVRNFRFWRSKRV